MQQAVRVEGVVDAWSSFRTELEADLGPALAALRRLVDDAGARPRPAAAVVAELTGTSANALYRALTDTK
jgi:hypothetical protein